MDCSTCGAANPAQAKFCHNCGAKLLSLCPNCGAEQPASAKFCNNCGHKLAEVAPPPQPQKSLAGGSDLDRFIPRELLRKLEAARTTGQMVGERRIVTMLFCDVKGSTAAAARFDPEEWAEIINGAFARMIEPIYRYEGTVARLMGDGLLAFFGAPIAHEDDPQRAVLAGLEVVEGIRDYSDEIRRVWGIDLTVRVGVNTGLVVVGAVGSDLRMEYSALGDAINLAARMEQTAQPGTVQIAEATYRLVAPLFDVEAIEGLELKGVAEPVTVYRVIGKRDKPGSLRGIVGLDSPLVGRETEFRQLTAALEHLSEGQGGIISVIGEAGLGKSRLVAEARNAWHPVPASLWVEGKSQSYETTVPYAPFALALAQCAQLDPAMSRDERYVHLREQIERLLPGHGEELAPFVAQPMGLPVAAEDVERIQFLEPPMLRGKVFDAVTQWIEALTAVRPMVLYLDDIHWIDPTSLELLESLIPITGRAPLLILPAFRPRREDLSWQFHQMLGREYAHRYTAIQLQPLDPDQGRELVGNLLVIEDLPESVRALIVSRAEGNPFFVEETIRSLLDAGLVERQDGHWRATADIVRIQIPETLIGVITARLDRLEDADKQVVQAAAVLGREFDYSTLADLLDESRPLRQSLATLEHRELIRTIQDNRFTFKHVLTQEAAYESLLLSRRRQLHHRAADSILDADPERAAEIARHYLEARQPAQALPHLVQAGHQAAQAFAVQEAIGYYTQALGYEAIGDTATLRAAYEGLGGSFTMSDPVQAMAIYEKMLATAEARSDAPMTVSALNKLGSISALVMGRFDQAGAYLDRAEQLADQADDVDGYAELSIVRCQMCTVRADFDSVTHYMDGMIEGSMKTGNLDNVALGLGHTANSLLFLNRYDEAWEKAQEALSVAREIGARSHEAEMLTFVVPLTHIRNGDLDAALDSAREGVRIARRIGSINCIGDGEWIAAETLRSRGEYEEALAAGQRSLEAVRPMESFMPFYVVHPLSALGSTYIEISGRFTDKVAELHRHALSLLESPVGAIAGGSAWADLGWCALSVGDAEMAGELFGKGLNYPTMMMKVERPRHLAGMATVQLMNGNLDEAHRLAQEACVFTEANRMKHLYSLTRLTLGRVLAAGGHHEAALIELGRAEKVAREMMLRPMLWQTLIKSAHSCKALGRTEESARAAADAETVIDVIAGLFDDDELRTAFRQNASRQTALTVSPP